MRILVIEDEQVLQQQILKQCKEQGYSAQGTADGREGLYLASEYPFDMAIIDIGLPYLSGLDIIKTLRQKEMALPILILTARSRWQDKVEGLEAGADDYLVKPFHMEELLARIKSLLRRATGNPSHIIDCYPISIDTHTQKVKLNGQEVELTAFEYRLLEHLIRQQGKVLSKLVLADYLYPHDEDSDSNVIEVMVGRLRKKLDPKGDYQPIETLRGRGYRFTLCQ